MLNHISAVLFVVLTAAPALAADVSIAPDVSKFAVDAGETQSTVIAPGKNASACPAGRILVTDDFTRPSTISGGTQAGVVHWRDLGGALKEGTSIHDAPPAAEGYKYGSNDHNIVALPSGNVIYSIAAFSKQPLNPKPAWFDATYRTAVNPDGSLAWTFGPGARTVMLNWLSTDCGAHFKFVSAIDSITLSGGQCGFPQPTGPTPVAAQKFDMGGTDGPWLGLDPNSGMLIMTHKCVGNLPVSPTGPWALGASLNRTVILGSSDEGATWSEMGQLAPAVWGLHAVMQPAPGPLLALGVSTGLVIGRELAPNKWAFPSAVSVAGAVWGWSTAAVPRNLITANMWASTIATRVPNSRAVLLAFPYTWSKPSGPTIVPAPAVAPGPPKVINTYGYRLFVYDPAQPGNFTELPGITPTDTSNPQSAVTMHLTAIDPGQGPLLLYWYDIDGGGKTATIRGRVLYGPGQLSDPIEIRRVAGVPSRFALNPPHWYGDYKSAGGYAQPSPPGPSPLPSVYQYYPVWVEPDNTIRYTQVTVSIPKVSSLTVPGKLPIVLAKSAAQIALSEEELDQDQEHEHIRGKPEEPRR